MPTTFHPFRLLPTDRGKVTERPGYGALAAIKKGNVKVMNADLTSRPGPRITDGVRQIAKAIHPEDFE